MSVISLNTLPPPNVIETLDYESIYAERKAALIALYPPEDQGKVAATLELESEPLVKMLQENAYRELLLRQRINNAAAALLLAFAVGADLDHLAARWGVKRLVIQAADNTVNPPIPEILESDDRLRIRTQMALEGMTTAGSRESYIYHGLSADGHVADIDAISPSPACVTITVLSTEPDGVADAALLKKVDTALNAETVRPIADRVTPRSVSPVFYKINAQIYVYKQPEYEPIKAEANRRLQKLIVDSKKVGRDITQSAIFAAIHVEGVQRVELLEPLTDIIIENHQVGICTEYAINIVGEDH